MVFEPFYQVLWHKYLYKVTSYIASGESLIFTVFTIILRGQRAPTAKHAVYILYIYSLGFMVQSAIVYRVNLFIMPGLECAVYTLEYQIVKSPCCNYVVIVYCLSAWLE